jgi:hypothetical protein
MNVILVPTDELRSRDSSPVWWLDHRIDDRGSVSGKERHFFLCHLIQADSGVDPDSYSIGTGVYFPKR